MSLTIIGASAGSGKTTRLTREVVAAVGPRTSSPLAIDALLAVTYTRRAAGELVHRLRQSLVAAGAFDRAAELPLALVGTVHGVCLRLVQAHALDVGISPDVHVLPGTPSRRLAEALEGTLDVATRAELEALAERLSVERDARFRRVDWLRPVGHIMELARSNRIAPADLPAMAQRSWDGLRALLPPIDRSGTLDDDLDAALAVAIARLAAAPDGKKGTEGALKDARAIAQRRARGERRWSDWTGAAGLEPAVAHRATMAALIAVADRVGSHASLHGELERLIRAIFGAAGQGLAAYAAWKERRGVVDFVDMLEQALGLLDDPRVADELRGRLRMVVVDELQDTSPVQLALFARLHALAGRSVWVGDRKQCIFEYAGADPELMDAVTRWAEGGGGVTERLGENHRSREELVRTCAQLFVAAFAPHGLAAADVAVTSARRPVAGLGPPAGVWWLVGKKKESDLAGVAAGLRRLLDDPAGTRVLDRATEQARDLRASDVAVLVATNAEATQLADALHRLGVRAAIARTGLLATPEGTVVIAALRALLDPRDAAAIATLVAMDGFGGDPDGWLTSRIQATTARREARDAGTAPPPVVDATGPDAALAQVIEALRARLGELAPGELVDAVIAGLDLPTRCRRWPDPAQRLGNLDAIRALAASYEERCSIQREAATLAGLLRSMDAATQKHLVDDEERASDEQHVLGVADAVTIVTYHRSKGLEWPVVVLASLGRGGRRDAFAVAPETDRAAFDPTAPLGGRWIRYWPYPFGASGSALEDAAAASPTGRRVTQAEARERVRLLYVGFTRARDHLVLAIRRGSKGPSCAWLDELADDCGPLLALPGSDERDEASLGVRGAGATLTTRVWSFSGAQATSRVPMAAPTPLRFARPMDSSVHAPRARYGIAPSRATEEWPPSTPPRIGAIERLGAVTSLRAPKDFDWNAAGTALHAFLAADVAGLDPRERRLRADRLLAGSGLAVDRVLSVADALDAFIASRWPGAHVQREVAIEAAVGEGRDRRRVQGVIDLLVETDVGLVVIDHKLFPADVDAMVRTKALALAPQLSAYARALTLLGHPVASTWLHFPFAARLVEVVA